VLVDHARPERLGELVRTLRPLAPELEVYTEAPQLVEVRPGSTLVLVPRAEDADWLNINRPLFASRALRVVLFCTREVTVALSRGAVDFLDWVSLRLECPTGPAPFAVAGLRCALAAQVPGIVWTGGDLESSFHAARPRRVLRRVSAARPYEELVAEAKTGGRGDWLAWTEVDGEFRLRRVRWALAETRRRTRAILVEPAVRSPGWWEVHGRVAEPSEARERLRKAGAEQPGRLAALVDLEPESIELLSGLLERGLGARTLEEELRKGADPGSIVGRLASVHGVVTQSELVRGRAPPPAMRAFGAERARMRLLQGVELDAIEQRLRRGEQLDADDTAWWAGRAPSNREPPEPVGRRGEPAEVLLRGRPLTGGTWEQIASIALNAGDTDVAHTWARRAMEADPTKWAVLSQALRSQGRYSEAELLLRRQLQNARASDTARGWVLNELGIVLYQQGKYAEAEQLLRQSLAIREQALGTHHPAYGASLHALAGVLERQGQYAEAEQLLRQSLSIDGQTLRTHHPTYGASLHALAGVLDKQGQYAEAERLLRQSVAIHEQAVGTHHPDYGASLHELAGVLNRQGQYSEAERLLRQSLAIKKQVLGTHHPAYATSLHALAGVLDRQGQYAEAERLLRQSLDIKRQVLGTHHPAYSASLHELARVLGSQGQYAEAEQLLRQSLAIDEQALGPRHPELCPTLANLGFNLARQKRPHEGEPFLVRSVDIARETWGMNHPSTAQSLYLLAQVQAASRKPEAPTTARQAMDSLLNTLGAEHPITKQALPELRRILADGG
jgi:tetratricopeptide (TPR) repeat protein